MLPRNKLLIVWKNPGNEWEKVTEQQCCFCKPEGLRCRSLGWCPTLEELLWKRNTFSLNEPDEKSIVFNSGVWFLCYFVLGKISLENVPSLYQKRVFSKFVVRFSYIIFEHFFLIEQNPLWNKWQLYFNRYVQARPLINQPWRLQESLLSVMPKGLGSTPGSRGFGPISS